MSHAVRRQLVTVAVAASSIALVAAPTAVAAKKISKPEKAQNTAIKKAQKTATSAGKSAKKAGKDATKGIADAKAAAGKADAAQGGVNGILGQVPAVLDGLTKLAAGLTQAGEGLTKLGNALAAAEYGVVKVQLGTSDFPGAILTSGDIPDDSNSAVVSGSMLISVPAGATGVPVHLLAGVRSGEADGTGAANPVASAGIVTMSITSPTGGVSLGGGNTGAPVIPLTSASNGVGGPPVYPIPFKAPRVDASPNPFSFPTDKAIDLTDPATLQNITGGGAGPITVTNAGGTAAPAIVNVTVRFNDLTASATDVTA
ncbi:MAG: hypothetical protein JWM93_188 [Frankiales bacterium]|nr:hypothetical protein [Frankiales bacterium]